MNNIRILDCTMKFSAVIAVRAGSKRIVNKNIQAFGDSNLLIHKIRQLKQCPEIDEIIVSSDSDLMLQMAKDEGVLAHKRKSEYADEKSKSFGEMVEYVVSQIESDFIVWTPCVCPLCDENIISLALRKFKEEVMFNEDYDSLVSAKALKEYLWDRQKPLNYSLENHVKSQDLPDLFCVVNGCFIASKQTMLQNKFVHGNKPFLFEIDKIAAIDIDDEYDLSIARALYEKLYTKEKK